MKVKKIVRLFKQKNCLFSLPFFTLPLLGCISVEPEVELFQGPLPDPGFVAAVKENRRIPLGRGFTLENYPKAVEFVDGLLFDKGYMESVFSGLYKVTQNFGVGLYQPYQWYGMENINSIYYNAFRRGYQIFVLPSFAHSEQFVDFYRKYKAEIDGRENLLFFGLDNSFADGVLPLGTTVNATFKSEESSFVIGYAAAAYLAEKYEKEEDRLVAVFGGAPFSAVTDFLFGFLEGIKAYNATHERKTRVNSNEIDLTSGFNGAAENARIAIERALFGGKVKIAFPISGISVVQKLLAISENQPELLVIGVDVDLTLSNSQYKERFFTSSLKNSGKVVYDILRDFYTGSTYQLTPKFFAKQENLRIHKGLEEDWVGYAPSTAKDAKRINELLDQARSFFLTQLHDANSVFSKNIVKYKESTKDPFGGGLHSFINSLLKAVNS